MKEQAPYVSKTIEVFIKYVGRQYLNGVPNTRIPSIKNCLLNSLWFGGSPVFATVWF